MHSPRKTKPVQTGKPVQRVKPIEGPNFDRIVPAETWVDYSSPSKALMNLMALHAYTLAQWKPSNCMWTRGEGNLTEYVYGLPHWPIERWIDQVEARSWVTPLEAP